MDLPDTVRRTVERHQMFAPGQRVVVGVSGGPDSVALLHALHFWRDTWRITISAAHLDHGFRGDESAADADYVRALCQRLELPCRAEYQDVPEQKKRLRLSAQEAARRARHAFLRGVAAEVGADRIALGHTRDDRVETVLLNIFRGAGPDGLQGFPAVRPPLVRPLYDVTRAETSDYCERLGLQPRIDPSNASLDYRRNRVRHKLLPAIAEQFNPKVADAILRLSDLAAAESELLDQLALVSLSAIAVEQTDSWLTLRLSALNALPIAIRRRVLRLAIDRLRGDRYGVDHNAVERALRAADRGEVVAYELPRGESAPTCIQVEAGLIRLSRSLIRSQPAPWRLPLPLGGRVELPGGAGFIVTRVFDEVETALEDYRALRDKAGRPVVEHGALLFRMSDLRLPLVARSWISGDRMRPRGLNGSKKLQDIFVDRKVPKDRRSSIPVIVDAESIEIDGARATSGRVLGLLGVRGGESEVSMSFELPLPENYGACLLIMALSPTGST